MIVCLQDVVEFRRALAEPSGFHIGECQLEFPASVNRLLRAVNRVAPAHAPVRPLVHATVLPDGGRGFYGFHFSRSRCQSPL
jgi:hypothetical protein